MLRVEVTESKTKQRSFVSFFDDDTIETVRQRIGQTLNVHPDRLFILAHIERPKDYYSQNPHYWESLFSRLSLTEPILQRVPFSEYQTFYRSPPSSILYSEVDRSEWMSVPKSIQALYTPEEPFSEYMIFGVPLEKSFILPRTYDSVVSKIPSAFYPIPDMSKLVSTMYDVQSIRGFYCIAYDDSAESVQPIYYPFLRSTTPAVLSTEESNLLETNTKRILDLLSLKAPEPTDVSILRTRFHVPWIETDFGSAVRTRFEQIFYGLTVSKSVPCITYFTSNTEVSRHKFYVEDPKKKEPFVDLATWNSWWTNTKPSRNRPTLVLYRGKSNQHFDRVSVTSVDMVISTYRPEGYTESIEHIQKDVEDWLTNFDSILPFVNSSDLAKERWELQDMSFVAKYKKSIDNYDLRRFGCVTSIFDLADSNQSIFRFLRSDSSVQGITPIEMKVLQMIREAPSVSVGDIAKELSIPVDKARALFQKIQKDVEEEPKLLERALRGFPTMRIGTNTVLLSSTNRVEKPLQYANLLRYILSSPDAEDIDAVCPKRIEKVASKEIRVEEEVVDKAILDEYLDLIGDMDLEVPVSSKEEDAVEQEQPVDEKIMVKSDRKTLYNYFNTRLQKFDPDTYNTNHPDYEYPKKCEQKHQPIILSDADLKRIQGTPYDVRTFYEENRMLNIEGGIIVCPPFWCIRDEIPLEDGQLLNESGFQCCPVCKGKVKEKVNQNPQEYTVIKRDKVFQYPKYTKYKSPTTSELMPCCYKTPDTGAKKETVEDKYYILGETKTSVPAMRLSFISNELLNSLRIDETYESIKQQGRIQSPMSGFFRIGIGRPSETLPKLLNLKTTIPRPRDNIKITLRCSFFHTWTHLAEDGYEDIAEDIESEELARRIVGIDSAFQNGELSILQELEYSAIALQCDVFRIVNGSFDCMFPTRMTRGVLVLQDTIVSHVRRVGNSLTYSSNVYEQPFKKETKDEIDRLRGMLAHTAIPSYATAIECIEEILEHIDVYEYSIILDPYVRGQALYIPNKVILPFQATPLPDSKTPKLSGFENAKELPKHADVLKYLDIAKKYSDGYTWTEDMYNNQNERVEVRLKSGLRIPVIPEPVESSPTEVVETVNNVGERKMTFSSEDIRIKREYQKISYASEIYEFLLFELSKTLDEYPDLEAALTKNPTRKTLEPFLRSWFDERTRFVNITNPVDFISKIRTPCGQFKTKNECKGNVCGWNGTCKVEVKSSVQKDALFHRLASALVENAKIRSIVLDRRVTPFFSTILYMELPHELILSDMDVKV